jgi:hypothetical protein
MRQRRAGYGANTMEVPVFVRFRAIPWEKSK